jgi:O-antigen/teichoic acid export membrane protein
VGELSTRNFHDSVNGLLVVKSMGVARTIAKNAVFNFIATVSELVIGLVTSMVLTRSLGTEQYGLYAYLTWFLGLVVMVMDLGLSPMAQRFIAEAHGGGNAQLLKGLVRLTLILRGAAALVVTFVVLVSSGGWAVLTGDSGNQIYFVILALTALPHTLCYVPMSIFKGFQKYDYVAYIILGTGPLRMVLVIVLMLLGFDILELLFLQIGILALGALIGFYLLRRLIPLKDLRQPSPLDMATKKNALKYALTMVGIGAIEYLAFEQAEVFFVGLYCPLENVGFYTLATRLGSMLISVMPMTFGAVLLPAIAEQFGKGDTEKVKMIYLTSVRYLMIVTLPMAAGLVALANPVIVLFYGADYAPTALLLQILVIACVAVSIGYPAAAVIYGINRPGFILKTGVLSAFLNIGLCLWLIPRYEVLGAAIACSIPRIFYMLIRIIFVSRNSRATWPVWDTAKIVLASLIMGLAVYALQSQMGAALSIALCIPTGIVIYLAAVPALRIIGEQDMVILRGLQSSLPRVLQKHYATIIKVMERMVVRTRLANEK